MKNSQTEQAAVAWTSTLLQFAAGCGEARGAGPARDAMRALLPHVDLPVGALQTLRARLHRSACIASTSARKSMNCHFISADPNFKPFVSRTAGTGAGVTLASTVSRAPPCGGSRPADRSLNRNVEGIMDLMRHRPYLRALTPAQRRSWWEQRKRLRARVTIGTAWLPLQVRRSYAYAQWF